MVVQNIKQMIHLESKNPWLPDNIATVISLPFIKTSNCIFIAIGALTSPLKANDISKIYLPSHEGHLTIINNDKENSIFSCSPRDPET